MTRNLQEGYAHVRLIGEGSFSLVHEYREIGTNRAVAVKTLRNAFVSHAEYTRRFNKEIELLTTLATHPHVIELLDHDLKHKPPFYVMPLANSNLYDYIQRHNSILETHDRVSLADQVFAAIVYAHELGILHRDICPANVLVYTGTSTPTIKVSDFGLGKDVTAMSHATASSVSGFGHVYYVAPEQHQQLKQADARSDVYAVGKLLNFVMTGRRPDVYHQCDFGTIIRRATSQEPDSRYQSIQEMLEAYEAAKSLLFDAPVHTKRSVVDFHPDDAVDWMHFHNLAIAGNYDGHVWHGYIKPVIDLLLHEDNLPNYYAAVGTGIDDFVDTFSNRIDQCIGTTGWPFSSTWQFAHLFTEVFFCVKEDDTKLKCAISTWDIAYVSDQWNAQEFAKRVLQNLPNTIQGDLASHIVEQNTCSVDRFHFKGLQFPTVIRNALSRGC